MDKPEIRCVAVTGASGFVGQGILPMLTAAGIRVQAISRQTAPAGLDPAVTWCRIASYDDAGNLGAALTPEGGVAGVDCVVHLAGDPDRDRAPVTDQDTARATALVRAMAASGTRRLVLTSSIYARLASEAGSYGLAKRGIESVFVRAEEIETVVLRLPPVYGPGGHGGFAALTAMVRRGVPLPLGLASAPRAYLSIGNLAALLVHLVQLGQAPWGRATGRIFEPSDGRHIGTSDLVRHIARTCGRRPRLVPVPLGILRILGGLSGKSGMIAAAVSPLESTGNHLLAEVLGWSPHEHIPESLAYLGS